MRYLIALWLAPLLLFWSWFGLSYYNMNFGYVLLTRQAHDLIFELYGEVLGIDPTIIPGMIVKACIFDSFLLAGILAFRRRRRIGEWLKAQRARYQGEASSPKA